MKISANTAARKLDALRMIPMATLPQSLRVKIIRAQIAFDKAVTAYRADMEAAIERLKPEGFDERMARFAAALNPTDDNRDEAERLMAEPDWHDFKKEHDGIVVELDELSRKQADDDIYDVEAPAFDTTDFEHIAAAVPCGGVTKVKAAVKDDAGEPVFTEVSNDEILTYAIQVLS